MSICSFCQRCLIIVSILALTGCTYAMHDAMFGHGKEVKATPEKMRADAEWIINHFESICLQKPGQWKGNRCEHSYTTQWDTWGGSRDWFEVLTRGYATFDQVLKSHYTIVGGDHVVSRVYHKGWESKNTRSWRYLLGDGSIILTLDRSWEELPNEFETAIVEENIRFIIGLERAWTRSRAVDECIKKLPTTAADQCPGFMEAITKRPEAFTEDDLKRVVEGMAAVDRGLAYLAKEGGRTKAIYDNAAADRAEQKRRSAQAISAGIRQSLSNFDPSVRSLPFSTNTGTSQSVGQYAKLPPGMLARMEKREQELARQANNQAVIVTPEPSSGGRQVSSPAVPQGAASKPLPSSLKTAQAETSTEPAVREESERVYAEAIAYCWQNKHNYWFCHGPVQKTLVGTESLNNARDLSGCRYPNERRRWSFKEGAIFACDMGLENYDDDVAAIYNVPASIRNGLYQYACPTSNLGRCRSRQ